MTIWKGSNQVYAQREKQGGFAMFQVRLSTFILAVSLTCILCFGQTYASNGGNQMQENGTFVHTVLFWLNEEAGEGKRQQIIDDCKSLLGSISTVRFLAVGSPAGTARGVVDNSYDVGLVVHFADKAGHDHYQESEQHLKFIERNQETWSRVLVYDIQTE